MDRYLAMVSVSCHSLFDRDTIPGARKLTNAARQGFSGHHYVIMALCSMVASFLVNALFALVTRKSEPDPRWA